jgi:hypothetical protein
MIATLVTLPPKTFYAAMSAATTSLAAVATATFGAQ